jgi:hypothetical protein
MKIIITVKDKNLDRSVEEVLTIGEMIYKKYKLNYCKCKCMSNGTSLILEKRKA